MNGICVFKQIGAAGIETAAPIPNAAFDTRCEYCRTFDHDPDELDNCKAFVGECVSCGQSVVEMEAVETKRGLMHENCAEPVFPQVYEVTW